MSKDFSKAFTYNLQEANSKPAVLNGEFKDWENHILTSIKNRVNSSNRYKYGEDNKLLALCKDHARRHQQKRRRVNTLMLTHPFYLHLTHMGEVTSSNVRQEIKEYTDNLLTLLEQIRAKPRARVALLETIHHYAAATSLLLEQGLVDQVIFTLYDSGCPLDPDELIQFDGDIFFGGGYNGKCLKASIDKMKSMSLRSSIKGIQELVLNSPEDFKDTLKVSGINGLSPKQMITIQQLERRLRL